jgi:hypothetical protein
MLRFVSMGVEDKLKSSALAQLLALLVVACGGRYSTTGDSDGTGANGSGATRGKTTSPPDDDEPSGGVAVPGMPAQGGRSTGSGGAPASGGAAVGMGGTGFGFAGAPIGTAGTNAGAPVVHDQVCTAYCSALAKVCPESMESVGCYKLCMSDLATVQQSCRVKRLEDYECIASELPNGVSCEIGLAIAGKYCGSNGSRPPACVDDECVQEIYGDGSGCHAINLCPNGSADLHCIETGGIPACSCVVGSKVLMLMTGAMSSKQACVDETLQQQCWQLL